MRKAEIDRKFDEIVAFAEVEKFIDTPVKRYSSGMYVRLAFAVAAHLEPEILIVDEVLAVGDVQFQKKCLGKMGEVARGGRTVLFVSHNMGAIVSLCSRGILLEKGQVVCDDVASKVADFYHSRLYSIISDASDLSDAEHFGTGKARFTSVQVSPIGADGLQRNVLYTGGDLEIDVRVKASDTIEGANVALIIHDSSGYRLIDSNTALQGSFLNLSAGGEAVVRFRLKNLLLRPGVYFLSLWLGRGAVEDIDGIPYVATIAVEADPELVMHTETFPGTYQCQFGHSIEIKSAPARSQ